VSLDNILHSIVGMLFSTTCTIYRKWMIWTHDRSGMTFTKVI